MDSIGNEPTVVGVLERGGTQAHRKAELIEPVGQAAVDRNLILSEPQ